MDIEDLELSTRALSALRGNGVKTTDDLLEADLTPTGSFAKTPNCGQATLDELRKAVAGLKRSTAPVKAPRAVNHGVAAFPVNELDQVSGHIHEQHLGMTLRAYFAGRAMAAIISDPRRRGTLNSTDVASNAVAFADALIVALNKE